MALRWELRALRYTGTATNASLGRIGLAETLRSTDGALFETIAGRLIQLNVHAALRVLDVMAGATEDAKVLDWLVADGEIVQVVDLEPIRTTADQALVFSPPERSGTTLLPSPWLEIATVCVLPEAALPSTPKILMPAASGRLSTIVATTFHTNNLQSCAPEINTFAR